MECRAEDVVTPAREEITSVHNNGTRLIINMTQSLMTCGYDGVPTMGVAG